MEGICITPPDCESLNLYFKPDGNLIPMMVFAYPLDEVESVLSTPSFHSTLKTQFGGADTHMTIVRLMKYCFEKYMKDVEVFDESSYYETEDEIHLKMVMDGINRSRAALEETFDLNESKMEECSPEQMAEVVQKVLGKDLEKMKVIVSKR